MISRAGEGNKLKVLKTIFYRLSMDKLVTAVIFHPNAPREKVDIWTQNFGLGALARNTMSRHTVWGQTISQYSQGVIPCQYGYRSPGLWPWVVTWAGVRHLLPSLGITEIRNYGTFGEKSRNT